MRSFMLVHCVCVVCAGALMLRKWSWPKERGSLTEMMDGTDIQSLTRTLLSVDGYTHSLRLKAGAPWWYSLLH